MKRFWFMIMIAVAFMVLAPSAVAGGYGYYDRGGYYADHRSHRYEPYRYHRPPEFRNDGYRHWDRRSLYGYREVRREVRYQEYYQHRPRYVYHEPRHYRWNRPRRHHRGCRHW
jgi:hypothetical protein